MWACLWCGEEEEGGEGGKASTAVDVDKPLSAASAAAAAAAAANSSVITDDGGGRRGAEKVSPPICRSSLRGERQQPLITHLVVF